MSKNICADVLECQDSFFFYDNNNTQEKMTNKSFNKRCDVWLPKYIEICKPSPTCSPIFRA